MAKRNYVTSRKQDKERKAKHPGKRTTDWGTTYFESRLNRADKNISKRLKKGGKILSKKVTLKDILKGK